jgi:hypothetical protein
MADQQINLVDHTGGENTPDTRTESSRPPTAPDAHIDVLYENQRGWFVFGIPLFSSKALWNFRIDPAPWVDAQCKPSAVNITNAQVPDPSWAWDWKSWYVDMSLDVDEEGWQYSLLFKGSSCMALTHALFPGLTARRARQPPMVSQLRPTAALAPEAQKAEAAPTHEGVCTGEAVWRDLQHRHNAGQVVYLWGQLKYAGK